MVVGTGRDVDDVVDGAVVVEALVVGVGDAELEDGVVVGRTVLVAVVVVTGVVGPAGGLVVVTGLRDSRVPAIDDGAALDETGSNPGTVTAGRAGVLGAVVGAVETLDEATGSAFWPTALPQAASSSTVMP